MQFNDLAVIVACHGGISEPLLIFKGHEKRYLVGFGVVREGVEKRSEQVDTNLGLYEAPRKVCSLEKVTRCALVIGVEVVKILVTAHEFTGNAAAAGAIVEQCFQPAYFLSQFRCRWMGLRCAMGIICAPAGSHHKDCAKEQERCLHFFFGNFILYSASAMPALISDSLPRSSVRLKAEIRSRNNTPSMWSYSC